MKRVRIAVDVMSGDNPPSVLIRGSLSAALENKDFDIILVGREDIITKELDDFKKENSIISNVSICHTDEVIKMDESPVRACKLKPNSSVMLAAKLVEEGKADAYVSPGNSGATMMASLIHLKRIRGVKRPAIVATMPTISGYTILIDAGANVDITPECILQFSLMGTVYAEKILKISNPKVGILSIGNEEGKGNELSLKSFALLKDANINFIGNVEGKNINDGSCDVVVCDGFVGNIVLKVSEGVANILIKFIKNSIQKNVFRKLASFFLLPVFTELKKKVDAKEYGGALLIGTRGITVISHGNSNSVAIKNAIKFALFCVSNNLNDYITEIFNKDDKIFSE